MSLHIPYVVGGILGDTVWESSLQSLLRMRRRVSMKTVRGFASSSVKMVVANGSFVTCDTDGDVRWAWVALA